MDARIDRRTLAGAAAGSLLVLLCIAAARPAARDEAPPPTLAPFVTVTGADSHVRERRCERITTQEAWAALWLEHLGLPPQVPYGLYYNKAGLPLVDFERCMVVAVFAGATMNCAGYEAVPAPVAAEGAPSGEAVLRILAHSYQTLGPDGGGVDATPYAFFIVPRTLAPLVVQQQQRSMTERPGRVEEHARFPALPAVLPASAPEPLSPR